MLRVGDRGLGCWHPVSPLKDFAQTFLSDAAFASDSGTAVSDRSGAVLCGVAVPESRPNTDVRGGGSARSTKGPRSSCLAGTGPGPGPGN